MQGDYLLLASHWSLSMLIKSRISLRGIQTHVWPSTLALSCSVPLPWSFDPIIRTLAACRSAHAIVPCQGCQLFLLTDEFHMGQVRLRPFRKPGFTPIWSHNAFYIYLYILLSFYKTIKGSIMWNYGLSTWQTAGIHSFSQRYQKASCALGMDNVLETQKPKVLSVCPRRIHKCPGLFIPNLLTTLCAPRRYCVSLLCHSISGNIDCSK